MRALGGKGRPPLRRDRRGGDPDHYTPVVIGVHPTTVDTLHDLHARAGRT
jgi:hypothetical protein